MLALRNINKKPQTKQKKLQLLLCPNHNSKENQLLPEDIKGKLFIAGKR